MTFFNFLILNHDNVKIHSKELNKIAFFSLANGNIYVNFQKIPSTPTLLGQYGPFFFGTTFSSNDKTH